MSVYRQFFNIAHRSVKIPSASDFADRPEALRKRQQTDIHRDIWRRRSCLRESILPATPIAPGCNGNSNSNDNVTLVRRSSLEAI